MGKELEPIEPSYSSVIFGIPELQHLAGTKIPGYSSFSDYIDSTKGTAGMAEMFFAGLADTFQTEVPGSDDYNDAVESMLEETASRLDHHAQ